MADPALDIIASATGATATGSGSTITFQYPAGRGRAVYVGEGPAMLGVRANQAVYTEAVDFVATYGNDSVVVTLGANIPSIPANSPVSLQLTVRDTSGQPTVYGTALPDTIQPDGRQ